LSTVLEHLQNEGVNTNKVLDDIHELVIKTFATIQPIVEKAVDNNVPFKYAVLFATRERRRRVEEKK
jgi:hypothetical protein